MKSMHLALLLLTTTSCGALRVVPGSETYPWRPGFNSARFQQENLKVELQITEANPSAMRLTATVSNAGAEPLTIGPADFRAHGPSVQACGAPADPDRRLEGIRSALAATRPDTTEAVFDTVNGLLQTANNIKYGTSEGVGPDGTNETLSEQAEVWNRVAELEIQEKAWARDALRPVRVDPGQSVTGFIEFDCEMPEGTFELRFRDADPTVPFRVAKRSN